jgi:hypothetical protein
MSIAKVKALNAGSDPSLACSTVLNTAGLPSFSRVRGNAPCRLFRDAGFIGFGSGQQVARQVERICDQRRDNGAADYGRDKSGILRLIDDAVGQAE